MLNLKSKPAVKQQKQYANQNPIEALESIVTGVKDSMVDDLGKKSAGEIKNELLGIESQPQSKEHGDLSEGAELDLANISEQTVEITEMGRQYAQEVIHAGKRANAENSQEIQVKMQEILIEIKKLSQSSEELKDQVEVISMEQVGEDPGVYHFNFLEKMLSFLTGLRLNVEDSLAWFSALGSKKKARQYGSMAKKHGTSFTLSNERQVATQVG